MIATLGAGVSAPHLLFTTTAEVRMRRVGIAIGAGILAGGVAALIAGLMLDPFVTALRWAWGSARPRSQASPVL